MTSTIQRQNVVIFVPCFPLDSAVSCSPAIDNVVNLQKLPLISAGVFIASVSIWLRLYQHAIASVIRKLSKTLIELIQL